MEIESIFTLRNKVVLITGGASHLGSAMSEIVAEYGATLILASRNQENNHLLKEQIENQFKINVDVLPLDLSNPKSVIKLIDDIDSKYGRIDVLINNSYYGAGSELLDMTDEEWLKGIDGSINGVFRVTQAALKLMVRNQYGKIINIASMYGTVAPDVSIYEGNNYYNPANYGVGKAGIIQFTKYVASVYGNKGITCNSIAPGPFPNKTVQECDSFIEKLNNKVPIG